MTQNYDLHINWLQIKIQHDLHFLSQRSTYNRLSINVSMTMFVIFLSQIYSNM